MKNKELDELINQSLNQEPGYQLPAGFALKMAGIVTRRQQWKTDIREYLSILLIVVLLLSVAAGTYYFANNAVFMKIWLFMQQNMIPVILVTLILNFVFFADRVLLRLLFNRWSKT